MANRILSIPADLIPEEPLFESAVLEEAPARQSMLSRMLNGPARARAGHLLAQWEDADGVRIGRAFDVARPEPMAVEFAREDGSMGWQEAAPSLVIERAIPERARTLFLSSRLLGARIDLEPMQLEARGASARDRLPRPQEVRSFPAGGKGKFVINVIAERFTDAERFFTVASELQRWVFEQPPFDCLRDRITFRAYFWPSDPTTGLFNTPDSNLKGDLFHGDMEIAHRLLTPITNLRPTLILIDSTERGGAGGSRFLWNGGFHYHPSWASLGGVDRWPVFLHEFGHMLGLADEYETPHPCTSGNSACPVLDAQPNVAPETECWSPRWGAHLTDRNGPWPSTNEGEDFVGMFPGAFYDASRNYRPSYECLMRHTRTGFCRVCREHITAIVRAES